MLTTMFQWIEPMADAGATMYTFHYEAANDPIPCIRKIKEAGMKVRARPFILLGILPKDTLAGVAHCTVKPANRGITGIYGLLCPYKWVQVCNCKYSQEKKVWEGFLISRSDSFFL